MKKIALSLALLTTVVLLFGFGPPGLGSAGCNSNDVRGVTEVSVDPSNDSGDHSHLFGGGKQLSNNVETTDPPCICPKSSTGVVGGPCKPEKEWTCSGNTLVGWSGGKAGCYTSSWSCNGSCIEDGPKGTGCYPQGKDLGDGRIEICEELSPHPWDKYAPCDGISTDCKGCCEQSIYWQICVQTPSMVRPPTFNPKTDCTYSFRLNGVDVPVGDCVAAGNLGIDRGIDTCAKACPASQAPDAGPDNWCGKMIDSLQGNYVCRSCINAFVRCMQADNCANPSSCTNTAIACAQTCR